MNPKYYVILADTSAYSEDLINNLVADGLLIEVKEISDQVSREEFNSLVERVEILEGGS